MKDQLATIEVAKLAKQKGFDEYCNHVVSLYHDKIRRLEYYEGTITANEDGFDKNSEIDDLIDNYDLTVLTQSLLQRWLREKHNLHINISVNQFGYGYMYSVVNSKIGSCIVNLVGGVNYKYSYEQALEKGLEKALEQIKDKE